MGNEMNSKPKALDLFCGAGGASRGLVLAGFNVIGGVDIVKQPRYPYEFILNNALMHNLSSVDFVWCSPPCQKWSAYNRREGHVKPRPDLIRFMRERLLKFDVLWCIENIPGAPLREPIQLCGSSFGLDIRRHRLFETNFLVPGIACNHLWQKPRFPSATNRQNLRRTVEIGVWRIGLDVQRKAMGIDWMTREELSQAVPPVYARHIGEHALKVLFGGRVNNGRHIL